ncbi:MAG: tyrosine-type recombinase/integrase [Alphaproteobacteria bacterium]|nr:tyrosine-type recombinase/integrase [Alphaproteobacteria bacterium]
MTKLTQQFESSADDLTIEGLAFMEDLVKNYLEYQGRYKRPQTLQEDRKLIQDIILPTFCHTCVAEITREDIEVLHQKLEETPYQANRVLSLLSKMFSFAVLRLWREDNPAHDIKRYPEQRERPLDKKTLDKLWDVFDSHPDNLASHALKFLTLTGARKSEVLQATWNQIDLEQGIWTKPASLTKQQKKECVTLSEEAIEVLQSVKQLNPQQTLYVFANQNEDGPLKTLKTFWKIALEEAKLSGIRFSDLRQACFSPLLTT